MDARMKGMNSDVQLHRETIAGKPETNQCWLATHIIKLSEQYWDRDAQHIKPSSQCPINLTSWFLPLMEEILHQLIGSLSHYLQSFLHPKGNDWESNLSSSGLTWGMKGHGGAFQANGMG